ncbi:MAG: 2-pyrone-4,6-dicarboxylate hydrolase [Bryobacterales bacterium]|nr:2-pyrone-4,6-dicarboxylate hydrolase [Bryobacterales bacterium]
MIARRAFIQRSAVALAAAASAKIGHAQQVPNSAGSEPAKLKAPLGACDCHHHIYDGVRFPPVEPGGTIIPEARFEEYRRLQKRIGTTRSIIVTPSAYVVDNRVTLDAIEKLNRNSRGVAVLHPTVTDAELKKLDAGGFRGIRFSISDRGKSATSVDMIEPLAKRVAALGWHIQINMSPDQIVALADVWNKVPSAIVFDHMGHVPQPVGLSHPVYGVIRKLVDKGRTWVKLSVTYDNTKDGPPGYADITKVAQAYVKAAPERMVWGSNWPHPNETTKPDDAMLFDLMAKWAPDEATRNRILVTNPATLYGFPKSA